MSGTSLDGVDVVIAAINSSNAFSLLDAKTYPIPARLKKDLLVLSQEQQADELQRYAELDVRTGQLFANCCLQLIQENELNPAQIRAIGSHGQTLRHYPDSQYPTTLQIGDPNIIAQTTGITTIADFRRRDMAAGGQGAPMVPPFHEALFRDKKKNRVILNIGGIANITFLPAGQKTVLGYDTGPGNGLMDDWCVRNFDCAYDNFGKLASQGRVDKSLLAQMLNDPFFSQAVPKSTGREYFSYQWIETQLQERAKSTKNRLPPVNILTTLLELSCLSISNEIKALSPHADELLVCGGGIKNDRFMLRLQQLMPEIKIISTENAGMHPDWVEASAFAWLAHQTLNRLTANLPSVTGAKEAVILGAIWPGTQERP